jgi:uncharacterized protein
VTSEQTPSWIAFAGTRRIAAGAPRAVATGIRNHLDRHAEARILVFDAVTSQPVEIDLRGSLAAILERLPAMPAVATARADDQPRARPPGRPRLGVVAREVTLLPRHWDWLAKQPGGASVALRKLVEEAQRANRHTDRRREAQESAFRFMNAMAGNEPGFEEATRALFAGDRAKLGRIMAEWPDDVRAHCESLLASAFAGPDDPAAGLESSTAVAAGR